MIQYFSNYPRSPKPSCDALIFRTHTVKGCVVMYRYESFDTAFSHIVRRSNKQSFKCGKLLPSQTCISSQYVTCLSLFNLLDTSTCVHTFAVLFFSNPRIASSEFHLYTKRMKLTVNQHTRQLFFDRQIDEIINTWPVWKRHDSFLSFE